MVKKNMNEFDFHWWPRVMFGKDDSVADRKAFEDIDLEVYADFDMPDHFVGVTPKESRVVDGSFTYSLVVFLLKSARCTVKLSNREAQLVCWDQYYGTRFSCTIPGNAGWVLWLLYEKPVKDYIKCELSISGNELPQGDFRRSIFVKKFPEREEVGKMTESTPIHPIVSAEKTRRICGLHALMVGR